MRLTASIVTHCTPLDQLYRALECLLRSDVERIHIVDNSPSGDLEAQLAHLEELFPGSGTSERIIYRHVENRGFGAGHNLALREASALNPGGAHIVMNADVCWEGDVPGAMAAYMKANPGVGIMAPKAVYPDGVLQYTCRRLPSPADVFMKRFLPRFMIRRRMDRYLLAAHDHTKPLDCPYLMGCFLMVRNSAAAQRGVFDERFFMYPEDIDLTRRYHSGGWQTLYWPEAEITHAHAAASRRNARMLGIHMANMARYFRKWGWISDRQRREINRRLDASLVACPEGKRPEGRG